MSLPPPVYENGIWTGYKLSTTPDYFRIGEKMFNELAKSPEFIGQIDSITGEEDTHGAMQDRAVRCAVWLKKQGIQPGDVIGYCSKNTLDSFAPLCASFYINSIFNPWWDSCLEKDLINYFIQLTKPKVVFADEESAELILKTLNPNEEGIQVIVFGNVDGLQSFRDIIKLITRQEVEAFQCTRVKSADDPTMIMYTSGTTGNPKGALYSAGSFANMMGFMPKYDGKQIGIWFSSLCWISGVGSQVRSIVHQSTSIVHNCISEEEACKIIEKFGVTWLTMGTAMVNRLYKIEEAWQYDMSTVNRVNFGGGVSKLEVMLFARKFFPNAAILCIYGTTEAGGITAGVLNIEKPTTVGKVVINAQIKVVDPDTHKILEADQSGEICVKAPSVMIHYWNNTRATAEAIDSDGWYHTGDVGYYDEDGDFYITERMKELIKYRLHHVPPAAIENVIQEHSEILEVGVVAKPDNNDMEQPMAFVIKRPGSEVTEEEIMALVSSRLHDRMRLRGGVCFLDTMPRTASGKIAKKELRAIARNLSMKS